MAEFQEIIKQFRRMCWYYQRQVKCDGCPMAGCNISQCRKLAFDRPDETEIIVTKWAVEHPVIYPMWCEWLADKGVIDVARMPVDYSGGIITEIKPSGKMYEHIPPDIAEKLGIEPKEGV